MSLSDHGAVVAAGHGIERSHHWSTEEYHFKVANQKCPACPLDHKVEWKFLQVHHKWPFHDVVLCGRPDLELDFRNLMTLCMDGVYNHHIALGHLGNFPSYNEDAVADCTRWYGKTWREIEADHAWKEKAQHRPLSYPHMPLPMQLAFRTHLDKTMPPDPVLLKKYNITIIRSDTACKCGFVGVSLRGLRRHQTVASHK